MLKMSYWFDGNLLQPDCNIHGSCKIASSACHACKNCIKIDSESHQVWCMGDGSQYKEVSLDELKVGDMFKTVNNVYGTVFTVKEIAKNGVRVTGDRMSMTVIKRKEVNRVYLIQ